MTIRSAHPERTPAAWTKQCLQVLQGIHAGYSRNRNATGRFIEFIRPEGNGLFVSQNFLRVRQNYSLCFALLFTTRTGFTRLYHPLFAGSRFDGNRPIYKQVVEDLGIFPSAPNYPQDLWSFSEWRSNTIELLAAGFARNEQFLLPAYRKLLHDGKRYLIEFFETARRLIPRLNPDLSAAAQATSLGVDPAALASFPLRTFPLNALTIAQGTCCVAWGDPDEIVDLRSIPAEVIVLHFADELRSERDRLDELVLAAESL